MAKEPQPTEAWVDLPQFLTVSGCTEIEVRKLSQKGILPKIIDSRLPFMSSLQKLIAHLRLPEISQTEAAGVLQVTPAWIRQMIDRGYMTLKGNGLLDAKDVWSGYIRYLKDEKRQSQKSAGETRVAAARASEIELRIAQKQRELIPLDDAMLAFSDLCGFVRQSMDGLAARTTRDIAIRKSIEKETDAVLQEISDRASERGRALAAGGDALEAGDNDEPGPVGSEKPGLSQDGRSAGSA